MVFSEPFQDMSDMDLMIFQRVGEDEDVIEVDHYEDISHVSENMVHKHLKHSGCVGESHRHDQELERAISGSEGCLPLVASRNANIVIAGAKVELGVDPCIAKLVEEVSDEGDRVLILARDFVEVSEVDAKPQSTILFLGEEDGCASWRLRCADETFAEHIIQEFPNETKLCAREWIDMAVRGSLIILKVNFMVKLTMRRHVLSLFT